MYYGRVMRDVPQLKRIREERALSQRDLAAMSGVAHDSIGQIERRERKARPSTVRKLAGALGVEPSILLAKTWNEAWEPMDRARGGHGLYEGSSEVQARRDQALKGVKALAKIYKQDMARRKDRPEINQARKQAREESKRRYEAAAEWISEGRWAEYYVAGQAAYVGNVDGDSTDAGLAAIRDYYEMEYLRSTLSLPKKAHQEERAIAWAKLDSGDYGELLEVAVETPLAVYELLEDLSNKQASFDNIPRRYFEDPDSRRRIEKLGAALRKYQHDAVEAVEALLELHAEALRQLEAVMEVMRKEGDELARIVQSRVSELLKS
jgi:transcriptional regulator with XRE-family HTH domain